MTIAPINRNSLAMPNDASGDAGVWGGKDAFGIGTSTATGREQQPISRDAKRRANTAADDARDTFGALAEKALSGGPDALESLDALARAVTGQSYHDLVVESEGVAELFEAFLQDVAAGVIRPDVRVAQVASGADLDGPERGDWLPEGVEGAFVSGRGGPDDYGTVLVGVGQEAKPLEAIMLEEFGEALTQAAEQVGLPVADGDAGARLAIVARGGDATAIPAGLFVSDASDTTEVMLDGDVIEASARDTTGEGADFALVDLLLDGDEALSGAKLGMRLDALGGGGFGSAAEAHMAVRLYGSGGPNNQFVVQRSGLSMMVSDGVLHFQDTGLGSEVGAIDLTTDS